MFLNRMWANPSWFASHVGMGPAVLDYQSVKFEYDKYGEHQELTGPIGSDGNFNIHVTRNPPSSGDRVKVRFSGPGLRDIGYSFTFRYDGSGVYSLDQMGCEISVFD